MSTRPVHFEIHAEKPTRAAGFYSAVFRWQFIKWDGPMPYWVINTGEGEGIDGGLVQRQGPPPAEGQPVNSFVLTVQVDSVDKAVEAVVKHGGSVGVPKFAVPGVGWIAYGKDTEGNIFGIHQPDTSAK